MAYEVNSKDTYKVGQKVIVTDKNFPEWNGPGVILDSTHGTGMYDVRLIEGPLKGESGAFFDDQLSLPPEG